MPSHSDISRLSQRLWQQKSVATESTGTTGLLQSPLDILPETANEAAIQSAMQSKKISAQTADAIPGPASSLASAPDRTAPLSNDAIRSKVADLSSKVSQTTPDQLSQICSSQMRQLAAVNRLAHDRIAAVPDLLKSQIMTTGLPDNVTLYLPNETAGAASKVAGLAQDRAAPGIAEVFQSSQSANGDVSIVGRRLIGNEWYNFGTDTNISSSQPASTWITPTRLLKSANPAQEKDLSAQRVIRDTQSLVDGPWKPYLKGAGLLSKPHTFDMRHSDKDGIKSVLATLDTITGTLKTIQSATKGIQQGLELIGMLGSLGSLGSYMQIFNQMKLPGTPGELITALITGKGINPNKPPAPPTADQTGSGKNGVLVTKGGAAAKAMGDGLLAKAEAEKKKAEEEAAAKKKAEEPSASPKPVLAPTATPFPPKQPTDQKKAEEPSASPKPVPAPTATPFPPKQPTDQSQAAVYQQNRQLNPWQVDIRAPVPGSVSHTFVYTTNDDGSLAHTYSWGNKGNGDSAVKPSHWYKDDGPDVSAAQTSIAMRNNYENAPLDQRDKLPVSFFPPEGGPELASHIDDAYNDLLRDENSPSRHNNWVIMNNCKTESQRLIDEAKKKSSENS